MVKAATYVLIPGAWHGAWSWRPVAQRLRAAGYQAITLTLPGLNDGDDPAGYKLSDAVDYIVDRVRRLNVDKVVLVPHSWGAYPATGAAHFLADQIRKIVYYNGLVPIRGRSLIDDNPPEMRELMLRMIHESPNGTVEFTLEYVEHFLMQGVAPELQRLVAGLLTPQPGRYFLDALDTPDAVTLGLPTAYIASDSDHAMHWPSAEFAARLSVQPTVVPGTHDSMLTHPDEVAEAILAA